MRTTPPRHGSTRPAASGPDASTVTRRRRRSRSAALLAVVLVLAVGLVACETPGEPCTGVLKSLTLRLTEQTAQQALQEHYSGGTQLTEDEVNWWWAALAFTYHQPRWQEGDTTVDTDMTEELTCVNGVWKYSDERRTTTTTTTATAAPTIASVSPSNGTTASAVVISGTGLTGATTVTFGGHAAYSFKIASDTRIEATVPHGSGTVDVVVVTPRGTAKKAGAFTYQI